MQDEVQVVTQLVVEHHQLVLEITLIQEEQQDGARMPKARALPQGQPERSCHQLLWTGQDSEVVVFISETKFTGSLHVYRKKYKICIIATKPKPKVSSPPTPTHGDELDERLQQLRQQLHVVRVDVAVDVTKETRRLGDQVTRQEVVTLFAHVVL